MALWVFLGVMGVFVLVGYLLPFALQGTVENRGFLGDSFGLVNAMFSGLALAGVILAIWLQSRELGLQREELGLTRDELTRQGDALMAQVETAASQRFDSTFFQMVALHHQIVDGLSLSPEAHRPPLLGRQVLNQLNDWIRSEIDDMTQDMVAGTTPEELGRQMDQIRDAYEFGYEQHEHLLGHYFRNLYRIVKFVDDANVEDADNYIGVIRAQLSSAELQLLFYNLFGPGRAKFLPLAEKYDLLDNLRYEEIDASHYYVMWKYRAATGPEGWKRLEVDGAPQTP